MARTAHAAVLAKESRAVSLYGEGGSYEEISEQLGYANRGRGGRRWTGACAPSPTTLT